MSKIAFFGIPAYGHTNPTIEVVRELVERGHEVRYYSYYFFRESIEAAGATFVACDDYNTEQKLEPGEVARASKDIALSTRVLVDTTLALDDIVCKDMEYLQPDCIVADSMAVWGKMIALKLNIPFVSSTTTFAFNQYSAKIMKKSMKEMITMIFSMSKAQKEIERLRKKGYPVKDFLDIIKNDENTDTIVYTSPEFQPCADTFSDKYAFVGPTIRPAVSKIEKKKEKLIYISMGTVNNDMLEFYENCILAFRDTEYQIIMSVGNCVDIDKLGDIPENISIVRQADQIAVLVQADAFLSHCGMNSVSESLYYQVPLVMYPQTTEQNGVAERVSQLGAGIRLANNRSLTIRKAVEEILNNPVYRKKAISISDGFKKCGGAKAAADKIMKMCK